MKGSGHARVHVRCGDLRPPLRRQVGGVRVPDGVRGEHVAADQAAQRLGQRRHVDGEPMAFQWPEGERKAGQHRPRLQQLQHDVAPVIEQRQRAGIPHQQPQPVEPVCGIARQQRQRAGVGLVGLHGATVEQPHVGQRAEQRAAVGAGNALLQVLDVADENRDARALLGDDMELIQPLFVAPEGQAGQEFLDGGVARPDREKDQVAVLVTDAAVGHEVGAFVDAIQRLGGMGAGMVLSSKESETARPAWAVDCPKGWKKTPGTAGEEKDPCVATHRSLEGLGYLGMLSASPTDMELACCNGQTYVSNKAQPAPSPFAGHLGRPPKKKRTMPRWARSA
jgi:hypothetical protein